MGTNAQVKTRVSVLIYFYKQVCGMNGHKDQPVFKLPLIINKSLR